jgi:hypothetical protein
LEELFKNKEYNSLNDVPSINFGTYHIDLDIDFFNNESARLLKLDDVKKTGAKNVNLFCNMNSLSKSNLSNYLNEKIGISFDWNFEFFKSSEPAGLHTDYESFENTWKPKKDGKVTHNYHVIVGVIIPLEWNCKQPYTVNYNKVSIVPRKLIYRNGEMRYKDNNEVVNYRDNWIYDPEVLIYNPEGTEYYREYADLQIHSVYEWKKGTMLVFDTARWHSSSWFLSSNTVINPPTEYKKSIIGFGSVDIIKK